MDITDTPSGRGPLADLEQRDDFIRRHIGPSEADQAEMLASLGVESLQALIAQTVPVAILDAEPLPLPEAESEPEALAALKSIAAKNRVLKSFIGMGYYGCLTPAVIQRNVLENPAWYTAYTPYQPEISQGRLEALLNFQTLVCDLTAMEIANASLLDEGTAAAEAMTFCQRVARSRGPVFVVDEGCHPQTIDVLRTRAEPLGIEVRVGDPERQVAVADCFGVLLQYPASTGEIRDPTPVVEKAHAKGALVAVAADLLALTLVRAPGEFEADVALGSTQRFGVPLGYGGPHAAYFATRDAYKRMMPGRLVGVSIDSRGEPAYRLAMQTREQHIRREKATSNICTAQVLLAVVAAMYAFYHGPQGLATIAARVHRLTSIFAAGLAGLGWKLAEEPFFDTLTVAAEEAAATIHARARAA